MAKLASLIPSVGSALGIFVVNNITVPYIEPFPKPLKGTPYESMAIINSMLTEKFCCRSLAPVVIPLALLWQCNCPSRRF
jgi:hypothetical protein